MRSDEEWTQYVSSLLGAHADGMEEMIENSTDRQVTINSLLMDTFNMLNCDENRQKINAFFQPSTNSYDVAQQWKNKGNASFCKKEFSDAIRYYTYGLLELVVNNQADTMLQSVLYTNRCAAFHAMNELSYAFQDATYAIKSNMRYPKAWFRRSKVLEDCMKTNLELANALVKCCGNSESPQMVCAQDLKIAQGLVSNISGAAVEARNYLSKLDETMSKEANSQILTLDEYTYIQNIEVAPTKNAGRGILATQSIAAGALIISELPASITLCQEYTSSHCSMCFKSILCLYPCDHCSSEMYCSNNCQSSSWLLWHKYECGLHRKIQNEYRLAYRLYLKLLFHKSPEKLCDTNCSASLAQTDFPSLSSSFSIKEWSENDSANLKGLLNNSLVCKLNKYYVKVIFPKKAL